MEATLAILRLIIVQALTNAALFYHFQAKYRKMNRTLTFIVFGEADSSHGFAHILEALHLRLHYHEAMMTAALQ